MTTLPEGIFWLHIKKSGGTSVRKVLGPLYQEVDRKKQPANFIQSPKKCWNDILNNYRIPLGEYQFRRSFFAREYLYSSDWDQRFKFAFCREPTDRCLSQFFYLHFRSGTRNTITRRTRMLGKFDFGSELSYEFDRFLERIAKSRASKSNYRPEGLHFQTHTAAMWDDVTCDKGIVILDRIYRLEEMADGLNEVFEIFGMPRQGADQLPRANTGEKRSFQLSKEQRTKVEDLFAKDFDLYEGCAR